MIRFAVHTDQEAFDLVCAHLKQQRRRAASEVTGTNENVGCWYVMEDGRRCAIGALLDWDTRADRIDLMEAGEDVMGLAEAYMPDEIEYTNHGDLVSGMIPSLLSQLQRVHDSADNWTDAGFKGWHALLSIGVEYDLNRDVVWACQVDPQ